MHNKDNKTLERLFSHPITMNLEWDEVKHMLETMGAEIELTHHSHVKITLGENTRTFTTFNHKNLGDKHEIIELKEMITSAGLAPNN